MTPKEKAIELVLKFTEHAAFHFKLGNSEAFEDNSKQCAIECADQMIKSHYEFGYDYTDFKEYYELVKTEIEKL